MHILCARENPALFYLKLGMPKLVAVCFDMAVNLEHWNAISNIEKCYTCK